MRPTISRASWTLLLLLGACQGAERVPVGLAADPATVDLGAIEPGQSAGLVVHVQVANVGSLPVDLSTAHLEGAASSWIRLDKGGLDERLAPGEVGVLALVADRLPVDAPRGLFRAELVVAGIGVGGSGGCAPRTLPDGKVRLEVPVELSVVASCDEDGDGVQSTFCGGADCDDGNALVRPGAAERCNGVDDDCDGQVAATEADSDGDGWRTCAGDCDDQDAAVHPGAEEACDGRDSDCNGSVPASEWDLDGDGFAACAECDDADPAVFPGAVEVCNGIDDDCDGFVSPTEEDADGDGWSTCAGDCIDGLADVFPGAVERCNGLDDNCDGTADEGLADDADGDGFSVCAGDCDDSNPGVNPDADEVCDGLDTDCDGVLPADEADDDGDLSRVCDGDCNDADPFALPGFPEICDGVDNDCDGVVPDAELDGDGDGLPDCGP